MPVNYILGQIREIYGQIRLIRIFTAAQGQKRVSKGLAKRKSRDIVTQALTAQRVFVACWALGAILSGSMGFAAYYFGSGAGNFNTYAGMRIPPPGTVSTTASIGRDSIEVFPSKYSHDAQDSARVSALRDELATLRMRLTALAQQNERYSARLAALEDQSNASVAPGLAKAAETGSASGAPQQAAPPLPASSMDQENGPLPQASPAPDQANKIPAVRKVETLPAPETMEGAAIFRRGNPEQTTPAVTPVAGQAQQVSAAKVEPVRFAASSPALPPIDDSPVVTGSIPEQDVPEPKPVLVTPGRAAGRVSSAEGTAVRRSDFAAVVGHFKDEAAAREAWKNFQYQNADRMRGMQARVMASELNPGELDLLLGPFANAADAAVACLKLLDISGACRPAFFSGTDLPSDQAQQSAATGF